MNTPPKSEGPRSANQGPSEPTHQMNDEKDETIMAQKKQKITEAAELEPVELDPPAPEIARWQELADIDIDIYHGGDASKILPMPRPAWADPDHDQTGKGWRDTCYRSAPAEVALKNGKNCAADDDAWNPASAVVSGHMFADGDCMVQMSIKKLFNEKEGWRYFGAGLRLEEAVELAHLLLAAVDLVGGEK